MMIIEIAQAGPIADAPTISQIVRNAVQFVTSIVGVLAVLMMVVGGVMYMSAGGDPKRVNQAKMTIVGGVIGITIAALSLVIVTTIASLV